MTYNESGEAIQITGTVQDITKRKQIEAELEKHRHQLENLGGELTILSAIGERTQLKACVELETYPSSPDSREV